MYCGCGRVGVCEVQVICYVYIVRCVGWKVRWYGDGGDMVWV